MQTCRKNWSVAILSDQINFKTKIVNRDKEGHFRSIKGSIYQEGIIIINIYLPNNRGPKCMQQNFTDVRTGSIFFPSPLPSTTPCPINPSGYLGKIPKLSSPFQLLRSQESLQCHLKLNLNLVSSSTSSAEWSWDPGWEQGEMEGDPQPGEDTCSHPLVDSVLCEWQSRAGESAPSRGLSCLRRRILRTCSHANCTQISKPSLHVELYD